MSNVVVQLEVLFTESQNSQLLASEPSFNEALNYVLSYLKSNWSLFFPEKRLALLHRIRNLQLPESSSILDLGDSYEALDRLLIAGRTQTTTDEQNTGSAQLLAIPSAVEQQQPSSSGLPLQAVVDIEERYVEPADLAAIQEELCMNFDLQNLDALFVARTTAQQAATKPKRVTLKAATKPIQHSNRFKEGELPVSTKEPESNDQESLTTSLSETANVLRKASTCYCFSEGRFCFSETSRFSVSFKINSD